MLLRARVVLPISRPAIEDGAVLISGGRIEAVGRWRHWSRHYSGATRDLGEVILMPGLVNAHCHLDYTHMAGLFPSPRSFCDWIKLITTEKGQWTDIDFAKSWRAGADMLLRHGTTTVGDIEAVAALLPEAWNATPLRVISFLEMTGVRSRRDPKLILGEALSTIERLPTARSFAALSPHSPYSTTPALLRLSAAAARRRKLRVTTHLAESVAEFDMFRRARGEMFDWLRRNERDMSDCGGVSPVRHLARQRVLGPHLIAVHVNYLGPGDAQSLARSRTHVVHCPRSHAYFRHAPFPYHKLAAAGVNIALGTDSLASVATRPKHPAELNLFEELRAFVAANPAIPPGTALRLVTLNAGRALGLRGRVGEIRHNASADLIALPSRADSGHALESVLEHTGNVTASMIAGQWAITPL